MSKKPTRVSTGLGSVDEVLGGGLVRGSSVLLTSPPGAGKTTLCLQSATALVKQGHRVLFASGEQSTLDLISLQRRLLKRPALVFNGERGIHFIRTDNVDELVRSAEELNATVIFADSLQTLYVDDAVGDVGSALQTRAIANHLASFARARNVVVVLIGHLNKSGVIVGSEAIQHMVDVSLSMDLVYDEKGCTATDLRMIQTTKNRYGACASATMRFDERGFHALRIGRRERAKRGKSNVKTTRRRLFWV